MLLVMMRSSFRGSRGGVCSAGRSKDGPGPREQFLDDHLNISQQLHPRGFENIFPLKIANSQGSGEFGALWGGGKWEINHETQRDSPSINAGFLQSGDPTKRPKLVGFSNAIDLGVRNFRETPRTYRMLESIYGNTI